MNTKIVEYVYNLFYYTPSNLQAKTFEIWIRKLLNTSEKVSLVVFYLLLSGCQPASRQPVELKVRLRGQSEDHEQVSQSQQDPPHRENLEAHFDHPAQHPDVKHIEG